MNMLTTIKAKLNTLTDHLIDSPCIAVCKMDDDNAFCTGCYRSMAEISQWSAMTGDTKREVIRLSAERKQAHAKGKFIL